MKTSKDFEAQRQKELEALYEIREQDGKYKLYFKRKHGFKFKQSFPSRWQADGFAAKYLHQCCLVCLRKGQVYKTRHLGGVLKPGAEDLVGKETHCPECRTKYIVRATAWQLFRR